uniref:RNA guanine-7 methyltransferase activating subunit n=1 Tax=Gasterosteus aculeatus aculeatus TaxID=481459 RepID=A0AAQ4R520_GASAC
MAETTESQRNYEEMFSHRFTSDDKEYQQYVNRPADPPPIVEGWRSRGGGGGGGGRDRDRDGDRHSGYGGGHRSGPPSYNDGHNSTHQRPQYDRY